MYAAAATPPPPPPSYIGVLHVQLSAMTISADPGSAYGHMQPRWHSHDTGSLFSGAPSSTSGHEPKDTTLSHTVPFLDAAACSERESATHSHAATPRAMSSAVRTGS